MVSEKSLGFGFGKFGIIKKVSVSVSVKILVSSFSDPGIWVEFAPDNGNGTGDPGPLMLKDPGYAISHLLYNLVLVEGHGFTFVICSYPVILLILESLWNSIKIKQLKSEIG